VSALLERYVAEALDELQHKTVVDIEAETALKWCGRAVAAMQLGLEEDAHEYAHEAMEHAALTGDVPLLMAVRSAIIESGARW
jgi:hypothetical protein